MFSVEEDPAKVYRVHIYSPQPLGNPASYQQQRAPIGRAGNQKVNAFSKPIQPIGRGVPQFLPVKPRVKPVAVGFPNSSPGVPLPSVPPQAVFRSQNSIAKRNQALFGDLKKFYTAIDDHHIQWGLYSLLTLGTRDIYSAMWQTPMPIVVHICYLAKASHDKLRIDHIKQTNEELDRGQCHSLYLI